MGSSLGTFNCKWRRENPSSCDKQKDRSTGSMNLYKARRALLAAAQLSSGTKPADGRPLSRAGPIGVLINRRPTSLSLRIVWTHKRRHRDKADKRDF